MSPMGNEHKMTAKEARMRAGDILAQKGTRLVLCESILLMLAQIMVYLIIYNVFSLIAMRVSDPDVATLLLIPCLILWIVLAHLITLPLLYSYFVLCKQAAMGKRIFLSELFLPFTSKENYKTLLLYANSAFWHWILAFDVIVVTMVAKELINSVLPSLVWIIPILFAVECVAFLFLNAFRFYALYELLFPEMQARGAFCASLRFWWSGGIWWVLLGLLTCGILLIADTLPRLSVAYIEYCEKLQMPLAHLQTAERN